MNGYIFEIISTRRTLVQVMGGEESEAKEKALKKKQFFIELEGCTTIKDWRETDAIELLLVFPVPVNSEEKEEKEEEQKTSQPVTPPSFGEFFREVRIALDDSYHWHLKEDADYRKDSLVHAPESVDLVHRCWVNGNTAQETAEIVDTRWKHLNT